MGVNQNLLVQKRKEVDSAKLKTIVMDSNSSPTFFHVIHRGNPSHYLRHYFNFCYYVGIIPFRFVFDAERNTYKLHTNKVQRFFCIVTLSLCLMEEVISIVRLVEDIHYPEEGKDDPLAYFEVFNSISNFVYYITVIRTIWCKSPRFLALMKILVEGDTQYSRSSGNMKAKLWVSLTIVGFIIYPVCFLSGFFIRRPNVTWDEVIDIWSSQVSHVLFLETIVKHSNSIVKTVFAAFRIAFLIAYTQITTAMEVLLVNSAMLLYDSVQDFRQMVKDTSGNVGSLQILQEYTQLRNVSRKLNKAVGFLTFGLTIACMPYYIVNLLEFIKPSNAAQFIRHLWFFINVFGFLILAAWTHKKALILQELVLTTRNFQDVPIPRLCILLHDMSGGNVGFSGSGFFKVTTGFLGTIISLLLTFSIIIIQFKTSNNPIAVNVVS